jgi:hypothetical protein
LFVHRAAEKILFKNAARQIKKKIKKKKRETRQNSAKPEGL